MTALAADAYDLRTLLDAWESSLRAVAELGRRLDPQQWDAPTECPGWSAGDVVRHLAWIEAFLAGRADPEHEVDWSRFPHLTTDFGRMTEVGVDVRRPHPQEQVCDELAGLVDVRLAQILALDPLGLDTEVMGVFGKPVPLQNLLRVRTFDAWTHLQDVRRATGLPGDLATSGAQVSASQMARSLPFVLARNVGAPPGTTLRLEVTGDVAFTRWAGVDDDGRGVEIDDLAAPGSPTIWLRTDWETYARLCTGRLDVSDPAVLARVEVGHDAAGPADAAELAARLPEALAITP
ncbi:MAG: maleylpyruvate isomerase family mycothiol-dependent enzyme [Frankiales bacterium]|nr:maleylpyruvate isomerase family mycothiol-dependent enzyme [Frankiales bacterium]